MSTNYYSQALLQQILYLSNLKQIEQLQQEIAQLKAGIFSRQKKHRRCDKDISKNFNCLHCEKNYASDVALKLHIRLKHHGVQVSGEPQVEVQAEGEGVKCQEEKSTSQSPFDCGILNEGL